MNMIQAIIFDMDGVISDTQKLHSKVEARLLSRFGINLSPDEITKKYAGVKTKEFFATLLKNVDCDLDQLMEEKWSKMKKLAAETVEAIPGAINLIQQLSAENYQLAVASASNFEYVQTVLKTLDVLKYFSVIISGDMVENGKPDPESFLLAASKMKVKPENCLVIEDGVSGMQAATKGGMKCIGLVTNLNQNYPTHNLVTKLADITSGYLNKLQ